MEAFRAAIAITLWICFSYSWFAMLFGEKARGIYWQLRAAGIVYWITLTFGGACMIFMDIKWP